MSNEWTSVTASSTTVRNASRFIEFGTLASSSLSGGVDFAPAISRSAPFVITSIDPITLISNDSRF